MEYRIIKSDIDGFWEDKKSHSFGIKSLEKNVTINLTKNVISTESLGVNVSLSRDKIKAKISAEGKKVKGVVKDSDKLYIGNELIAEFNTSTKPSKEIKMPKINWNLWAGVIVLLLILVTIFLGWKKNTTDGIENKFKTVFGEINDKVKKSDEIKSIDPETSLKLLNEANKLLQTIKDIKNHDQEITEIDSQIKNKLVVSGSTEVSGFSEIYNTKTADAVDRNYNKMAISNNEAVLVEINSQKVIQVNLESLSANKIEVNSEIKNIVDINLLNNIVYIYDGKIVWDQKNNKVVDTGSEVFIKILSWNNSWYLLGQDGKISKSTDNKISLWTDNNAKLIDKPVSMAIDGTIWVVDASGNVANYEKGVNKKWTPSTNIGPNIIGITTSADSANLAIISNKKVFVFEKTGKLLATHNFEKIGIIEAKMGKDSQIYVLGNDLKIYKVK